MFDRLNMHNANRRLIVICRYCYEMAVNEQLNIDAVLFGNLIASVKENTNCRY